MENEQETRSGISTCINHTQQKLESCNRTNDYKKTNQHLQIKNRALTFQHWWLKVQFFHKIKKSLYNLKQLSKPQENKKEQINKNKILKSCIPIKEQEINSGAIFQEWNFFNFCSFHQPFSLTTTQGPSRTFRELCHPNPKIKQRNALEKAQNTESSKDTIYGSLSALLQNQIWWPLTHTLN